MPTITRTAAQQKLTAKVNELTTRQMFDALDALESKAGEWLVGLTPEEVIVRSELIGCIENRHNLGDAVLDLLDQDEDTKATYPELLRLAMEDTGQEIA